MPTTRFPRTARVRARSDFDRIFKHGRRVALPVLALHWQSDPAGTSAESTMAASTNPAATARLGLAVSRKVDPHAVGRNRIKRVLRDSFRRLRPELPGGDYVVVARVGAARCSGEELRHAFLGLLQRAGALPASVAPGTMPAAAASPCSSTDRSAVGGPPSSDPASAPRVG